MFNNNLKKRFIKILISANELIENFFNSIKNFVNLRKRNKAQFKKIDKKITISLSLTVILVSSYFLIPTFYDKNKVRLLLENQLNEKYNLKVKFEDKLNYNLFPKPHFSTKNLVINYNEKKLAVSKNAKIYISFNKFFSLNQMNTQKIFFRKNEFNIDPDTISFFKNILNFNKDKNEVFFEDSNLFYKNQLDEIIFLSKLKKLKFSYNSENLDQVMNLNFKIFNLPFQLSIINNQINKNVISYLKSKKIRLNIENKFNYEQKIIVGLFKTLIMNKEKKFEYQVNEKFLSFISKDENFDGKIYFKPFYLKSNLKLEQLNFNKLFSERSILINLINSELLFNQNLNANLNINLDKLSNTSYLNNLNLKVFLEEGEIIIKDSDIDWNQSIKINLNNVELTNENNEIKFVGQVNFDFNNLSKFYSYYQITRSDRKNIDKISLDFVFNLSQKKMSLDNLKIDNKLDNNVNDLLNEFNSQNKNIFNKVTFRNFVKNVFSNYEG